MSQIWKITGYDGDQTVYERRIRLGSISEAGMITLLKCLAARHLDEDEIVESSLRKNAKEPPSHLEVRKDASGLWTTGTKTNGRPYSWCPRTF